MEESIEVSNDIIMSQEDLCAIVSYNTKVEEKEVKIVIDSFINLFIEKLNL